MILKLIVFVVITTILIKFLLIYLPKQIPRTKKTPPPGLDALAKEAENLSYKRDLIEDELAETQRKMNKVKNKLNS